MRGGFYVQRPGYFGGGIGRDFRNRHGGPSLYQNIGVLRIIAERDKRIDLGIGVKDEVRRDIRTGHAVERHALASHGQQALDGKRLHVHAQPLANDTGIDGMGGANANLLILRLLAELSGGSQLCTLAAGQQGSACGMTPKL